MVFQYPPHFNSTPYCLISDILKGKSDQLLLLNTTSGGGGQGALLLTAYQENLHRWSSVGNKGGFYLMASFYLRHLGNKSKEKEKRV